MFILSVGFNYHFDFNSKIPECAQLAYHNMNMIIMLNCTLQLTPIFHNGWLCDLNWKNSHDSHYRWLVMDGYGQTAIHSYTLWTYCNDKPFFWLNLFFILSPICNEIIR